VQRTATRVNLIDGWLHAQPENHRGGTALPNTARWRLALEPHILSILRIVVGLLYMEHGLNKLFDFPPTPTHMPYRLFSLVPGLAGLLESFGGLLITVGLYTRIVAFVLAGEMAFAYFMAHAPKSFFPYLNGGIAAVLYCFVFLYFAVAGGGPWSLDRLREKRSGRAA
jgi:putative oxidoreductase